MKASSSEAMRRTAKNTSETSTIPEIIICDESEEFALGLDHAFEAAVLSVIKSEFEHAHEVHTRLG